MRKVVSALASLVLIGGFAIPAMAQPMEGVGAQHNEALGGFGAFEGFLKEHPEMKNELEADPNKINNEEWVEKHPALTEFYRNHPEVRTEMQQNAPDFMRREKVNMAYQHGFNNFHNYLKNHPEVEQQIEKNPAAAEDPQFQKAHPEFHQYLQEHPEVAWQMKHDPNQFFHSEDRSLENSPGGERSVGNAGMNASPREERREKMEERPENMNSGSAASPAPHHKHH